jgi:holo-[acyl-carrier protein] synthase
LASELQQLRAALKSALTRRGEHRRPDLPPRGVGVDVLDVAEVELSLATQPARYPRRVYTDVELRECRRPGGELDPGALALRFAAKEAALKALGVVDDAIPWRSIEIRRGGFDKPTLALTGAAAALGQMRGIEEFDVSLIQAGRYAASIVVAHGRSAA